ncbi:MAG: hydantoinase B/oxoprolinase family protein [Gemmatimonadetes bacterium]|nr:hydantoinase B/oxoprolinase family protein [Gemmatimonadota bacterium]
MGNGKRETGNVKGDAGRAPVLDAIGLEVMAHAFAGIAEEMGAVLVASAVSPNVRERRDSSAALFDAQGEMIAQAAHIPVHLGAMPDAVAAVRALAPRPGDTFILNDPFTGGTHLPDITMVHAIELAGTVAGFTVVRAHHSDVGGMRPGSMPPHSTDLFQEGLVLPPVRWAAAGVVHQDLRRLLLANVRTPEMRAHDLAAQQAACERGAVRYRELAQRHGADYVAGAVQDLLAYAERRTRASLAARVAPGVYRAEDWLEGDGVEEREIAIRVAVEITADGRLRCDFTGEGTLVNATWPHAVAAANVETSQRITDTLFAALASAAQVPAQGQGTMNNVVFGGAGWTYYETLGGGQGASPGAPGPSGVHVGMSNTRNTPVEVFELEHPLRIRAYALRRGSGGAGRWRGGEGVVREYEALEEIDASLLTERRRHAPRGAQGGGNGATGRNLLNGEPLGARAAVTLHPGDILRVETPGGGGYASSAAFS